MKYLIIGRIGSNKKKLAMELRKTGISVADRNYNINSILLEDACVTDLDSLPSFPNIMTDYSFHIVFMEASQAFRKENAIAGGMSRRQFEKIEREENAAFQAFEKNWIKYGCYPANVTTLHRFSEEGSSYKEISDCLAAYMRKYKNLKCIVQSCIDKGMVRSRVPGKAVRYVQVEGNYFEEDVSIDAFIDLLLTSPEGFNTLLSSYLSYFELSRSSINHYMKKQHSVTGQISMCLTDDGSILMR